MNRHNDIRLYNILLPIWLLVLFPTWLWLILIPANYLIDRLVLRWSLGDMPDKGLFCRKHTWKVCLAGFVSDFAGAAVMLSVFFAAAVAEDNQSAQTQKLLDDLVYGVGFNPFANLVSFAIVLLAVAVGGLVIYLLDRWILRRAGLDIAQAKKSALRLALITAPYLYFFPTEILMNSGLYGL